MPSPGSEKFLVGSEATFFEQYLRNDKRYPPNTSLLEEINSNIEQQFNKVSKEIIGKIVSLNQELQRDVDKLPKKHDIEKLHEKHAPKALEDTISYLRKLLEDQQIVHTKTSKNLKLLQENICHQNKVLFSIFIGFVIAILLMCLYNVPMALVIPIISFNLYYFSHYITLFRIVVFVVIPIFFSALAIPYYIHYAYTHYYY